MDKVKIYTRVPLGDIVSITKGSLGQYNIHGLCSHIQV